MKRDDVMESLLVVPKAFLDSLTEKQNKILALLEKLQDKNQIGDYIPEAEAQKVLGRKTTWFWTMRSRGMLAFAKVGSKVFYSRRDIEQLLADHKCSITSHDVTKI